jgi:hypothetical protein
MKAVGKVKFCWSHNKSNFSSPLSCFQHYITAIRDEPFFSPLAAGKALIDVQTHPQRSANIQLS